MIKRCDRFKPQSDIKAQSTQVCEGAETGANASKHASSVTQQRVAGLDIPLGMKWHFQYELVIVVVMLKVNLVFWQNFTRRSFSSVTIDTLSIKIISNVYKLLRCSKLSNILNNILSKCFLLARCCPSLLSFEY